MGCSPWGCGESDTTEQLPFHFSLSCTGEGNGNPLQCSCLENSGDRGAWWAAVYGVAQNWTRLKRLSSSSSSIACRILVPRPGTEFYTPGMKHQVIITGPPDNFHVKGFFRTFHIYGLMCDKCLFFLSIFKELY